MNKKVLKCGISPKLLDLDNEITTTYSSVRTKKTGKLTTLANEEALPHWMELMLGTRKLGHSITFGTGKNKKKYWLVRTNDNRYKYHLMGEDGMCYQQCLCVDSQKGEIHASNFWLFGAMFYDNKGDWGFVSVGDEVVSVISKFPGTRRQLNLYGGSISHELFSTSYLRTMYTAESEKIDITKCEAIGDKHRWGTISFSCLSRFFAGADVYDSTLNAKTLKSTLDKISNGDLQLCAIDNEKNVVVTLTNEQEQEVEKERAFRRPINHSELETLKQYAPSTGFVPIRKHENDNINKPYSYTYHRSGVAVFYCKDTDSQIVLGVDDDLYFGSELPKGEFYKDTVSALLALAPKEARQHPRRKVSELLPGVKRQGEWFAVPVEGYEEIKHPIIYPDESLEISKLSLPRDSIFSASHIISTYNHRYRVPWKSLNKYISRQLKGIVQLNDFLSAWVHRPTGDIFIQSGVLEHSEMEHPELALDSKDICKEEPSSVAYKIMLNRAVRSFSEEGVD